MAAMMLYSKNQRWAAILLAGVALDGFAGKLGRESADTNIQSSLILPLYMFDFWSIPYLSGSQAMEVNSVMRANS
jgi:hypothetical protein